MNLKNKIWYGVGAFLAVVVGVLPGFFLVFNSIFSDGGALGERIFTFVYVFVAYVILGIIFGMTGPRFSWKWGIWLSIAALVFVILYTFRESERAVLHALYLVVTFSAACLGGYLGALFRE